MNVPIKYCDGDDIDDNEFDRSNTINDSIYSSNNIAHDVSHIPSRSPQHMQLTSPTDHDTSTHSNNYSSPRYILHNHNDNITQSTVNNIRHSKTLPPSIRYSLRSSATSPSQKQQQQRSRDTMVDSFHSSTIKPHFSHQNNNFKRRHNTLRNASTCSSTIKTQQNSSISSRGRSKFRSSPHHRNNLRHTNSISSTAH